MGFITEVRSVARCKVIILPKNILEIYGLQPNDAIEVEIRKLQKANTYAESNQQSKSQV
jgi:bifunctional DNA-binding transcriptional regulator/antitoxin component of YhaV-PrlF toxin-antitoxin module